MPISKPDYDNPKCSMDHFGKQARTTTTETSEHNKALQRSRKLTRLSYDIDSEMAFSVHFGNISQNANPHLGLVTAPHQSWLATSSPPSISTRAVAQLPALGAI